LEIASGWALPMTTSPVDREDNCRGQGSDAALPSAIIFHLNSKKTASLNPENQDISALSCSF
jgi:hypothetical protein